MDLEEIHLDGPQRAVTMTKYFKAMLTVRKVIMCYYLSFSKNSSTISRASYQGGDKVVIFHRHILIRRKGA